MKKNSKLKFALEDFMQSYYNQCNIFGSQVIGDLVSKRINDSSFIELFKLLSQDRKDVIETLQKSIAINKVFFKMRNDFVDDFIKELRKINSIKEEEEKNFKKENTTLHEKNKKLKKLVSELELSNKQKQTVKNILVLLNLK